MVDAKDTPLSVKPTDEFYFDGNQTLLATRLIKAGTYLCAQMFAFRDNGTKVPNGLVPIKKLGKNVRWGRGELNRISPYHDTEWSKVVVKAHHGWGTLINQILIHDYKLTGRISIEVSRWENWIYCENPEDSAQILSFLSESVMERAGE